MSEGFTLFSSLRSVFYVGRSVAVRNNMYYVYAHVVRDRVVIILVEMVGQNKFFKIKHQPIPAIISEIIALI